MWVRYVQSSTICTGIIAFRRRLTVHADNTNADIDTRAHWLQLADKMGVPVRCVLFTASAKLCEHNDTVRALGGTLVRFRLYLSV